MKDVKPFSKDEREGYKILFWMFVGSLILLLILKITLNF